MPDNPLAFAGANLVTWHRADVGLSQSAGVVTSWADQSPNGITITPGGSPAYRAAGYMGGPCANLDGIDDYYGSADLAINLGGVTTQLSAFVAGRMDLYASPPYNGRFVSTLSANSNVEDWSDANAAAMISRDNFSDAIKAETLSGVINSYAVVTPTNERYAVVFDGVNITSYKNNVQQAQTARAEPTQWGTSGTNTLSLVLGTHQRRPSGVYQIGDFWLKGGIGEVFLIKGPMTAAILAAADAWMIARAEHVAVSPWLVSVGAVASGIGTVTPGVPPVYQDNDVFLLFVEHANQAVATPAGWTAVTNGSQGSGTAGGTSAAGLQVFWKLASGTLTAPTVADAGDHTGAIIHAYRNVRLSGNPWDITAGAVAATSTAVSFPAVTTTVPNTLIVNAIGSMVDIATARLSASANANLADVIEQTDVSYIDGNGGGIAVVNGVMFAPGSTGSTTATLATTSVQAMVTIALAPPVHVLPPSPIIRPYVHSLMR